MKRRVAVTGVRLAHNRASDVGISRERDIRARRIQGTDEISGRRNGDRLSSVGVGGADAVKLHVRGEASVINEVPRFYAHVAIEEDLDVNARVDGYLSGEIAGDMDGDIGLGASTLIERHTFRPTGDEVVRRRGSGTGRCRGDGHVAIKRNGVGLGRGKAGHDQWGNGQWHIVVDDAVNEIRWAHVAAIGAHVAPDRPLMHAESRRIDGDTATVRIVVMRVRGIVSREVVWAVVRIETVNQTSRPWTVEPVRDLNRRSKGCDSSDNQFDPSCNLRGIDSYQGFAGAVTVGAVGGNEVIIVEVDFSQQGITVPASRPVSDEPISVAQAIIHTDANEPGQGGDSFCSNAVPFVAVDIGSEEIHHRTCLQTVRPIRGYRAGVGIPGVSPSAECP